MKHTPINTWIVANTVLQANRDQNRRATSLILAVALFAMVSVGFTSIAGIVA